MAALTFAELSTTEAFSACTSCLLCRGLFSCGPAVFVHDDAAWVQRRCSAGHMMCVAAAAGFAGVAALTFAELSTTEAFSACTSCLLCRGLFSCGPAVFVHDDDAWVQRRCSAGHMMCVQLPLDSVTALAIAKFSTTEAIAARASCLLCRGLFSCGSAVFVHDSDAWVQRRCSAGRMMCVQLPLDSQVWRRWQLPN
jgi:hypothetical protein